MSAIGGKGIRELLKPSKQKTWLKYFPDGAANEPMPKDTIYRQLRENNEAYRGDTALNYFGRKISYGTLLDEADRCAGAFAAAGVKKGDIVAAATVTIPEMVYALYGLNKIGAAPPDTRPEDKCGRSYGFHKADRGQNIHCH